VKSVGVSYKPLALLFITVLLATSLLIVDASAAQLIPKPSVPEFTVYLVNHPYDVPATLPTYTTDPYTGEQKQVSPGSPGNYTDKISIELWILNKQPSYSNATTDFTPYFNVRTKGHFEENWSVIGGCYQMEYMLNSNDTRPYIQGYKPAQTGYRYTVLNFSSTVPLRYYGIGGPTYPPNATVDFQVKVAIGHVAPVIRYEGHIIIAVPYEDTGIALDAESDWSETQSITINQNNTVLASTLENPANPELTPIPLPTDTPHPTVTPAYTKSPETTATQKPTSTNTIGNSQSSMNTWLLIAAVVFLIFAIWLFLFVRNRRIKKNKPSGY
jgi:hypothetical protein